MSGVRSCLLVSAAALLLSCGGAGDVAAPAPVSPAWVTIDSLAATATDTAGQSATARTVIDKTGPSFGLSGRVQTDDGAWGLGDRESGVQVNIEGPVSRVARPASGAAQGGYAATCLPPGRYTVAPASPALALAFQPAARTVDIVAADVGGVDFSAPAHRMAGRVSWAVSGLPSTAELMTLTGGTAALVRGVDSAGSYGFVVPDGAYSVSPGDPLCPACVYTPAQRAVGVLGFDIGGLDFLRE